MNEFELDQAANQIGSVVLPRIWLQALTASLKRQNGGANRAENKAGEIDSVDSMTLPRFAVAALVAVLGAVALGAESTVNGVRWDALNQGTDVIGRLGIRLGEVVEIEAKLVAGRELGSKEFDGSYLLEVQTVAGKAIDRKPVIAFYLDSWADVPLASDEFALYKLRTGKETGTLHERQVVELEKGYVGSAHRLLVYEVGEFSGIPRHLPDDYPVWQDHGFAFHTSLHVLKEVNTPPPTPTSAHVAPGFACTFLAKIHKVSMLDVPPRFLAGANYEPAEIKDSKSRQLMVGIDPRWGVSLTILEVDQKQDLFRKENDWTFLIHSPAQSFDEAAEKLPDQVVGFELNGTYQPDGTINFTRLRRVPALPDRLPEATSPAPPKP
jgi:hypothetical protein